MSENYESYATIIVDPTFVPEPEKVTAPFFAACEDMAHQYFDQFGHSTDNILQKERELLKMKADLAQFRAEIETIEGSLSNLAASKQATAYARLFNLAHLRDELEQSAWELECSLAAFRRIAFA